MSADFTVWTSDPFGGFEQPEMIYSNGEKIHDENDYVIDSLDNEHMNIEPMRTYFSVNQFSPPQDADSMVASNYVQSFLKSQGSKWSRNDFFRVYKVNRAIPRHYNLFLIFFIIISLFIFHY